MKLIEARNILLKIPNLTALERKAVKTVVAMIDRKNIGKCDSYYSLDLNDLPNEIWRCIKDYEDSYQISNFGRVKSFFDEKPRIIKANKVPEGYLRVRLYKNSVSKNHFIHRLVAQTFIPNIENKPQVNHINGIKTDNRVENLEWMTSEENINHAFKLGLSKAIKGSKNSSSKLTPDQIREIRQIYVKCSRKFGVVALAKKFNVSEETIRNIIKGRSYLDVFNQLRCQNVLLKPSNAVIRAFSSFQRTKALPEVPRLITYTAKQHFRHLKTSHSTPHCINKLKIAR